MSKGLERTAAWLLTLPAILPLIYVGGLLYPYVAPKTLLLRTLAICLAALFAYLILSNRPLYWTRLQNKLAWIPGALLLVAHVSSLFGVDFYHSFWSIFDRGDGLLTLTALVLFFYGTLLFADELLFRRITVFVVWVASCVAVYALLQWLQATAGIDLPLITEPRGRFGGTLGNAAYLASYLGLTVFLTLGAALEYRHTARHSRRRNALYASLALQLIAIFVAATRGTLLALALAAFFAVVYFAWKGNGSIRTYARALCVAGLVAAALFFVFREPLSHSSIESVRRVASISLRDATVESRLFIWRNMLQDVMSRPLMGYGAEHVDVPFNRFYDPTAIGEQWFDRSHNSFLDYLVQYGALGLLLYTSLIIAFAYTAIQAFKGGAQRAGLMVLLAIVYAVQNFFVFDTASTFWLFLFLFAGLLAGGSTTTLARVPKLPHLVSIGVSCAILILIIPVTIQPLRANLLLAEGYLYHIADVNRAVSAMEKGLSLGTYADLEYGYQAYQMYTERQATMLSGDERIRAYRYAVNTLGNNFDAYPYDARTAVYLGHVLDTAPPEIEVNDEEIRRILHLAIELSPKRLQPWYLLANVDIRRADQMSPGRERDQLYLQGIQTLKEYAAVVPKSAEPRYIIATLYLVVGDFGEAKTWADEALPLYVKDGSVARRAARYYITVEDWENARRFLRDLVESNGADYPVLYDLAKAEFLAGDRDTALEIVEKLRIDAPGIVEGDPTFLAALEGQ